MMLRSTFHQRRVLRAKDPQRGRKRASVQAQKRLLCFGSGFTVTALQRAIDELEPSWEVYTTQRDLHKLTSSDFVLSSIPPDAESGMDPVLSAHKQDLVASTCEWVGYLSSTAVYGEHEGQLVTEDSELLAVSKKLKRIIEAERSWLEMYKYSERKLPVHVFRLGGIYGPGRSALDAVRKMRGQSSTQRRRSGQATTTRVHVDDIVQALLLSMRAPSPGETFNIVDDDCSSRIAAMEFAAELLKVQLPTQTSPPTAHKQQRGNKRVSNAKSKAVLGWQPRFPSYRDGLQSVFAQEQTSVVSGTSAVEE